MEPPPGRAETKVPGRGVSNFEESFHSPKKTDVARQVSAQFLSHALAQVDVIPKIVHTELKVAEKSVRAIEIAARDVRLAWRIQSGRWKAWASAIRWQKQWLRRPPTIKSPDYFTAVARCNSLKSATLSQRIAWSGARQKLP